MLANEWQPTWPYFTLTYFTAEQEGQSDGGGKIRMDEDDEIQKIVVGRKRVGQKYPEIHTVHAYQICYIMFVFSVYFYLNC